jgi:hypothetical protein
MIPAPLLLLYVCAMVGVVYVAATWPAPTAIVVVVLALGLWWGWRIHR